MQPNQQPSQTNRRQRLIVNKSAQQRMVIAVTLFPSIALAAATLVVAIFCRRLFGEAARAEVELPSLMPLCVALLTFVLTSGLVILVHALRFSHRVSGPAYRLVKSMERIREGDIGFRVKLRSGDHLTEVAEEMNRLLAWLNANPPASVTTTDAGMTSATPAPTSAPAKVAEPVLGAR